MRRTRLRSNPESTRAWQQRSRKPLPAKSLRRVERERTEDRPRVRAEVLERDGICVATVLDPSHACWGGPQAHHLRKEGAGGSYTPANLVRLCSEANTRVEDEPWWAKPLGLVVNHEISDDEARTRRIAHGWTAS